MQRTRKLLFEAEGFRRNFSFRGPPESQVPEILGLAR